jgi:hypothetical protein
LNGIRDKATLENPNQISEGMEIVLANGVPVIEDAKMIGALSGKFLREPGYVPSRCCSTPHAHCGAETLAL